MTDSKKTMHLVISELTRETACFPGMPVGTALRNRVEPQSLDSFTWRMSTEGFRVLETRRYYTKK